MFPSKGKEAVRHFKFLPKFIMSWRNIFYYLKNTRDLLTYWPCKCGLWSLALTSCWGCSALLAFLVWTLSLSCRHFKISSCSLNLWSRHSPLLAADDWRNRSHKLGYSSPSCLQPYKLVCSCSFLPSCYLKSGFFFLLCVFWILHSSPV